MEVCNKGVGRHIFFYEGITLKEVYFSIGFEGLWDLVCATESVRLVCVRREAKDLIGFKEKCCNYWRDILNLGLTFKDFSKNNAQF